MMKASIGQGILSIPPDRKICNQLKLSGAETEGSALRYDDSSFWQDTLRKMNNTIMRFMETIELINSAVSGKELPTNTDLEQILFSFAESMNGLLSACNRACNENDMATGNGSGGVQDNLLKLRGILISVLKMQESSGEEISVNLKSIGVKLMNDASLAIDKRTVRDAISSRGGEVIKAVKTIVSSLFEVMPLCIDPNSGNLVNVRRKLEENDGNHSEVTAALTERLEKERCELMEKLRITELLIAHSNQFLDNLKLSAGFFPIIHSLYDSSGHGL